MVFRDYVHQSPCAEFCFDSFSFSFWRFLFNELHFTSCCRFFSVILRCHIILWLNLQFLVSYKPIVLQGYTSFCYSFHKMFETHLVVSSCIQIVMAIVRGFTKPIRKKNIPINLFNCFGSIKSSFFCNYSLRFTHKFDILSNFVALFVCLFTEWTSQYTTSLMANDVKIDEIFIFKNNRAPLTQ